MSFSDVSAATKFFSLANEGFNTTLSNTITAGATSVGLNSTTNLTNGSVFVGIIEPGTVSEQTFTGTVDVGGLQITNVVWTRGTNVGHAAGVAVVDYVTGTSNNLTTIGILKQHTQAGLHTSITNTGGFSTDTLSASGNATVGGTLGVTGATTLTGAVGGAGYSLATISNPYKFSVYRSVDQSISSAATTKIQFNTEEYDTSNNYDSATNYRFTAPIAGFYFFSAMGRYAGGVGATGSTIGAILYKNGVEYKRGDAIKGTGDSLSDSKSQVSTLVQLATNDYIEVYAYNGDPGSARSITGGANYSQFYGFLMFAT